MYLIRQELGDYFSHCDLYSLGGDTMLAGQTKQTVEEEWQGMNGAGPSLRNAFIETHVLHVPV